MLDMPMPKVSLGDDDDEISIIAQWLIDEGASFREGDPIVEVETAKANMEVEAPQDGVLAAQLRSVGDSVVPGDVLAVLAAVGEHFDSQELRSQRVTASSVVHADGQDAPESPAPVPNHEQSALATQEVPSAADEDSSATDETAAAPPPVPTTTGTFAQSGALYGPPRRKRPRLQNVSVQQVAGTAAVPAAQREPLSRHRRALAKAMTRSAAIPQFSVHRKLPMDAAQRVVASLRATGVPATLTDVILKATAEALVRHPEINSLFIDEDCHRYSEPAIALAADSPSGVIAPVIRHCDTLSWSELARERRRVVDGARNGRLLPADMSGGTFSISNVGALGGDAVVPMLTPPQVAILGLGQVQPAWGGTIAEGVLVADHRALDGADAARFLNSLAEILADTALADNGAARV